MFQIGARSILAAAIIALASVVPASSIFAAVTTTTFQVQITIVDECEISSVNNLNFGSHGVLSANIDVTTTFAVQCTLGTPFTIGLNEGVGSGATTATRRMTGPGPGFATIDYRLYRESTHTNIWGNDPGNDTVNGVGNGSAETFTIYGRVPPQVTPPAGLYLDTVTITVEF
jgi:spore coat protein U-like protein